MAKQPAPKAAFEDALIELMDKYAEHATLDQIATGLELQLIEKRKQQHAEAVNDEPTADDEDQNGSR